MGAALHVVLGITGGIAAYKMPHLVRLLRKGGAEVKVVLTCAARALVGPEALRTLSGNPLYSDGQPSEYDMDHIRLAQWGHVLLICPATANTIAKIAHGIGDNLLTTLALSFEGRTVVAPAMNAAMWNNPAVRENCRLLRERGVRVLPVDKGELACGDEGEGRMIPPEAVARAIFAASAGGALKGKKVLISSGPTREMIDAVRYVSNLSSGKMGAALAEAALDMGAEVTVVTGPATAPLPPSARTVPVVSAAQMLRVMKKEFSGADLCLLAAAVSDFRPAAPLPGKIDRRGRASLNLELEASPDIAEALGRTKGKTFLVGFALEEKEGAARAAVKMRTKRCDLMVLNHIGESIGLDTTTLSIVYKDGTVEQLPAMGKLEAARQVLDRAARRMGLSDG